MTYLMHFIQALLYKELFLHTTQNNGVQFDTRNFSIITYLINIIVIFLFVTPNIALLTSHIYALGAYQPTPTHL